MQEGGETLYYALRDERHFLYDSVDMDRCTLDDIPELHQLDKVNIGVLARAVIMVV